MTGCNREQVPAARCHRGAQDGEREGRWQREDVLRLGLADAEDEAGGPGGVLAGSAGRRSDLLRLRVGIAEHVQQAVGVEVRHSAAEIYPWCPGGSTREWAF